MTDTSARARLERFAQQFRHGDPNVALTMIEALTADFPDQAPLHWHHARALRTLGHHAEARRAVQRVIELKADYAPAWLLRAELALDDPKADAHSDVRQALKLDPRLARAHFLLARLLRDTDRLDEAQAALDTALDLDPGQHEAYVERGDWRRKAAMLGFGDGPADPDVIQTVSGQRWSRSGLEAARSDYQSALDLHNDPRVRLRLANVLHELGAYEQALAAFDAVLAVTPQDEAAYSAILAMRARSLDGGRGENAQMAQLLEQALAQADAQDRASWQQDAGQSMLQSAAAGLRGGLSLQEALDQFVSEDSDDAVAVDIAWKIHALAHEATPQFTASSAQAYPAFMREYAEQVSSVLSAQGFRVVGDYEPSHLTAQLGRPTLVRLYAANDGVTCGASYCIEPKWPGWLAFLALKLRGKWHRPAVLELETVFDDGGFLITNNAGASSPFVYRGKVDLLALADTPPAVLHARHRERIERYRREHPHATAERVDTEARILALQRRISVAKGDFRRSIGYIEDSELRQLLGAHYERLATRVRDKLNKLIEVAP